MDSERQTHLITSCSKSKIRQGCSWPELTISKSDSPSEAITRWVDKVTMARDCLQVPAVSLYTGNHWSTAKEILRTTENLELWVISAGMGFLNSRDLTSAYEATFHQIPFRHTRWWSELSKSIGKKNTFASINQLMNARPLDQYVIAASPVYISAVENDILEGIDNLEYPLTQLTIVTSAAYSGPLNCFVTRSSSRMKNELGTNMVALNIKLAQYVINSQRRNFI